MSELESLFEPLGDGRFRASEIARGPWDPNALHGGSVTGLLGELVERFEPHAEFVVTRAAFDLYGSAPVGELIVALRETRPGKRIQMLEATVEAGGRTVCRSSFVRQRSEDVGPGREELPELDSFTPPPLLDEAGPPIAMPDSPPMLGGAAIEIRFAEGGFDRPGPAAAWFRWLVPPLGQPASTLSLALAAADFANGISAAVRFDQYLFVNTDLTVHLHRYPEGEWVLLDARTLLEPDGRGLASARLFDQQGPIGLAAQALFVDRR